VVLGLGERQDGQSDRGDQQPGQLPAFELEAEEPLGEDRQEHKAGGDDGLDNRQRRQRQGTDVPRAQRDQPADRPRLGAKPVDCAAQGMAREHGRCRDRAALLEQHSDAAGQRAADREQQAGDHRLVSERPPRRLVVGGAVRIASSSPTFCSRAIGSGRGKCALIV
jgi:hypothetical protein